MEGWRSNLHVMMVHTCALEHYRPVDWDLLKKTDEVNAKVAVNARLLRCWNKQEKKMCESGEQ